MSKFFAKCEVCKKRKFYISVRDFIAPITKETIKSKDMLCDFCYKNVKKMLKS
jgi:hypothetical protein